MANLDSIKLRIGIDDTKQDDLLNDLISDAEQMVLSYIDQDGGTTDTVPAHAEWVVKSIVIEMYNRIGDEGKASGTEGNVSNTWERIDLTQYASVLDRYREKSYRLKPGVRFV